MELITELHMHGRYSRATSKDLTIANLEKYARLKGLQVLGIGDFTHPLWIKEIAEATTEDEHGILRTSSGFPFIWQSEISLMYSDGGKGRRIHNIVLAPNREIVRQITDYLMTKGRVDYDGRPIFGISCPEFVERLKEISSDIEIIPAHVWTPWFSIFGSKSGFDSVEECFQDQAGHIHALETGLSSDPAMNWRLSKLDKFNLVSSSDAHSHWPWRVGREATVLNVAHSQVRYRDILSAIRDTEDGVTMTFEVDPGYGMYHVDGHRACGISMEPEDARKLNNICPACKRPLTVGVLHRVEDLADRPAGYVKKGAPPFKTLLPLSELIAAVVEKGLATKEVWSVFYSLVKDGRTELDILLRTPKEELMSLIKLFRITKIVKPEIAMGIADAIIDNREGRIQMKPGYDGVYGVPIVRGKMATQSTSPQLLKTKIKKAEIKKTDKPLPPEPAIRERQVGLGLF